MTLIVLSASLLLLLLLLALLWPRVPGSAPLIDRATGRPTSEPVPFANRWKLFVLFQTRLGWLLCKLPPMRAYLATISRNKGKQYDRADSKALIRQFVRDYGVRAGDAEKPVEEYRTLNEFFYRKLRPGLRPIAARDDDWVAVQPCDCRLHVFQSVEAAQRLWIKGSSFSLTALTGSRERTFAGGSLALCRLAPTDYHRFHSPVDGVVGDAVQLSGEYFSVKHMAVRSPVDVLTTNKRVYLPIRSDRFGTVGYVMVGATHVGSIVLTVQSGDRVRKGDEIGYFAYGGSTIVVLFQAGAIKFDRDLVVNSLGGAETLVRIGTTLGSTAE